MRAGRGAAVCIVAKGVNMHATVRIGVLARDIPRDGGRGGLGLLLKGDGTRNLGVTPDDSD